MKPFIKETIVVISFIAICVFIKSACVSMYKNSHEIPTVTDDMQESFNVGLMGNEDFSLELDGLEYLDYPNYEFDNQISTVSQLKNINEARRQILDERAREYGRKTGIWCLFVLLGLRYGRKIFHWIKS